MQATASETSVNESSVALQGHVYGAALLSAMEAGLENAWERVRQSGAVYCSPRFAAETRAQLARSIVAGATGGERHAERLSEHAVSSLFPLGLFSDMPPDRVGLGSLSSRKAGPRQADPRSTDTNCHVQSGPTEAGEHGTG